MNFNFPCVHSLHGFFPGKSSKQLQATVVFVILCRDSFQIFLFFRSLRLFLGVEKMFRVFYDCACFKMHVEVLFFQAFPTISLAKHFLIY